MVQDQLTFLGVLETFNCAKTYIRIILIIIIIIIIICYRLYSGYLLLHT